MKRRQPRSTLFPYTTLFRSTGATLRWLGLTDDGRLDLSDLATVVNERTKLVAVTQQSNILGTINPLGEIVARAHEVGALVLVEDRKSTRLNSSHANISYAVF